MLEIRVRIRVLTAQVAECGQGGSSKVSHLESFVCPPQQLVASLLALGQSSVLTHGETFLTVILFISDLCSGIQPIPPAFRTSRTFRGSHKDSPLASPQSWKIFMCKISLS